MDFKLSFYTVISDLSFVDETKFCIYSTRSGNTVFIEEEYVKQIRVNEFELLPNELIETLINSKIIVPKLENEFETCLEENQSFIEDSKTLSYTIQPTGQCQLGCGYCGQEHRSVVMTEEIIEATFQRIKTICLKEKYEALSITWYGGEPLIASRQIHILSEKLIQFCNNRNIVYSADVITNGLAINSEEKIRKLVVDSKVTQYQITLDSFGKYHNKRRPMKNGGDSFQKIFDNIKMFANTEVYKVENCQISLRMNIDKSNYLSIEKFIDFLAENDLQKKISLSFSTVFDWGGNDASKNSFSPDEFSQLEISWQLAAMEKGFTFGDFLPQRKYATCMVVDKNSEVYDAYGNIYPCYELPYTPKYENAENLIGNVKVDSVENIKTNMPLRNWHELVKGDEVGCNTCKFFPVCGGGCPKSWLEGEPACPSFKFNIEELIGMEYLDKKNGLKTLN